MSKAIDWITEHGLPPYDAVKAAVPALVDRLSGPTGDYDDHQMAAQFALDVQAAGAKPEAVEKAHDLMQTILNGDNLETEDGLTLYSLVALWVADHQPVKA